MARSPRTKRRSRGPRKDWVYRGYEYDADTGGVLSVQVASYTGLDRNGGAFTLAGAASGGHILVDSVDYLTQGTRNVVGGIATMMGREARPEGRRTHIHAAEVDVFLQPTSWTAGTDFCIGARLVICDQNLTTGGLDLPTAYAFLANGVFNPIDQEPSVYANGWGNLAERILRQAFATENDMARFRLRFRWRGKRTLQPHMCLGLLLENTGPSVGSTSIRYGLRCRSLVTGV